MNKPVTVEQLLRICQDEISKGNGDKSIMISSDDEGNSYHYLWYGFQTANDMMKSITDAGLPQEYAYIEGMDERVASADDTIILG